MKVSRYTQMKLVYILLTTGIAALLGGLFASFLFGGFRVITISQGIICGSVIGFSVFFMEYFVFDRIRRFSLYLVLLAKSFLYSIIVVLSYMISDLILYDIRTLIHDMRNFLLPILAFSMVAVFIFMLIVNINRLLGQKSLRRIIFGQYHKPVIEKRIFMFVDLDSSTSIAEEMGDKGFHAFLNSFLFDITIPIIECRGEIYKYVGDEVIVTWSMKAGIDNGNCLQCIFLIENALEDEKLKYEKKYGRIPRFSAALHCGEVVVGEMGDFRREVAFLGDVVNTTARIQSECKKRSKPFIISQSLKDELGDSLLSGYSLENLGTIAMRGKKKEVELFSVKKK